QGILNHMGGRIGESAVVSDTISGDLSVGGDAVFQISNFGNTDSLNGGLIGENASIAVTAANFASSSLLALINSSSGGAIGTNAAITFNISGTATVSGDATFDIDVSAPATGVARVGTGSAVAVAGNAINVNGGTYSVGGTF